MDSRAAIQIIEAATNTHPHYHIVLQLRRMMQRNWEVRIEHIYREGNIVADFLASTADRACFTGRDSSDSGPRPAVAALTSL
ncbi:unnamed protein product [Linum trigynum]|uniref:RNase H type-1 domain-containing protein n=1 Tax=Linum trigynum TaxID=586398 RepID=A0AAV2GAF0_9ROSI